MKQGAKYISTANSPAGYGSAARVFITALYCVGVDVTTQILYQMAERINYGFTGELCLNLENRNIPYKINIIHLTPDTGLTYLEKGKYGQDYFKVFKNNFLEKGKEFFAE